MKYRINYFEQIKLFFETVPSMEIRFGVNHRSMYLALLYLNNKCGWEDWMSCSMETLKKLSGIGSNTTYYKILKDIEKSGLIKYNPGNSKVKFMKIHIVKLSKNEHINQYNMFETVQDECKSVHIADKTVHIKEQNVYDTGHSSNNNITCNSLSNENERERILKINKENITSPQPSPKTGEGVRREVEIINKVKSLWNEYLLMREKIGAKVKTDIAREKLYESLYKICKADAFKAIEILEKAIASEWKFFEPPKKS